MTIVIDDQITENDLLTELAREINEDATRFRPGDITLAALIKATGADRQYLRDFLHRKTLAGELVEVPAVLVDGHRMTVWRKA